MAGVLGHGKSRGHRHPNVVILIITCHSLMICPGEGKNTNLKDWDILKVATKLKLLNVFKNPLTSHQRWLSMS
jgi:hypothetical protein